MRAIGIAIAAISLMATTASAESGVGFGKGPGSDTCREFLEQSAKDPESELLSFAWAEGFMTGSNVTIAATGRQQYRDLSGETTAQMATIRSFCDSHPTSGYVDAVMYLYTHLPLARMSPH